MSSNDIIFLLKVGDHYEIIHSDVGSETTYSKKTAKTAYGALVEAQAMQDSTQAEYGVQIDVLRTKEI